MNNPDPLETPEETISPAPRYHVMDIDMVQVPLVRDSPPSDDSKTPCAVKFFGSGQTAVFNAAKHHINELEGTHEETLNALHKIGIAWDKICTFGVPCPDSRKSPGF